MTIPGGADSKAESTLWRLRRRDLLPFVRGDATFGEIGRDVPGVNGRRSLDALILTDELPSADEAKELAGLLPCLKCSTTEAGYVSYELNGAVSMLLARCRRCGEALTHLFSTDHGALQGVMIILGSPKGLEYQNELAGLKCGCGQPTRAPDLKLHTFRFKHILPFQLKCTVCTRSVTCAFWQTPMHFYEHDQQIARKVRSVSPEAALVFSVAALETFLQKAFAFHTPMNLFLVDTRKVSFQRLEEAAELYARHFALSLKEIAGSSWLDLSSAFRKRHNVVHNSANDKDFNPVVVSESDAIGVDKGVEKLVLAIDRELRRKCVY